jgi:HTH DNA binding domain
LAPTPQHGGVESHFDVRIWFEQLQALRLTSRLPARVECMEARPIISAGMIAEELEVTPRGAQNLVAELGLREATRRGRYRACRIL